MGRRAAPAERRGRPCVRTPTPTSSAQGVMRRDDDPRRASGGYRGRNFGTLAAAPHLCARRAPAGFFCPRGPPGTRAPSSGKKRPPPGESPDAPEALPRGGLPGPCEASCGSSRLRFGFADADDQRGRVGDRIARGVRCQRLVRPVAPASREGGSAGAALPRTPRGGTDVMTNLRALCHTCHRKPTDRKHWAVVGGRGTDGKGIACEPDSSVSRVLYGSGGLRWLDTVPLRSRNAAGLTAPSAASGRPPRASAGNTAGRRPLPRG